MKEACEKYGVKVAQMHGPFPLYVDGREDINECLIQTVDKICAVAQYLGCPAVVVHPFKYYVDKKKEREVNLGIYRKMMSSAKKYGVILCLENLFDTRNKSFVEGVCTSPEEAIWYLDTLNAEAGEKLFGFCLDIGHLNLLGSNIRHFIDRMGDYITILHIHDNTGNTADAHVIPYTQSANGKCYLDWEDMIEGLKDIGYAGPLSFETFYGIKVMPEELQPTGLKLVSEIGKYFRKRLS